MLYHRFKTNHLVGRGLEESSDGTLRFNLGFVGACQGLNSLLCELRDDGDLVVADTLREERPDGLTVERPGEGGAVGVAELELEGSEESVDDGGLDGESHGEDSNHKSQELQKKGSKELSKDDGSEDSDEKRKELLQLSSNIQTSILLSRSIVGVVV